MRLNCVVQEESLARAKEEDEKRNEVTGRFQVSLGRHCIRLKCGFITLNLFRNLGIFILSTTPQFVQLYSVLLLKCSVYGWASRLGLGWRNSHQTSMGA